MLNVQVHFNLWLFDIDVELFDKYKLGKNKLHLRKHNPIKCKMVNYLKINELHVTFEDFFCSLFFFPNVKILTIKNSKVINIKGSRNYKLTIPLLLNANYIDMDDATGEKIKNIRMLSWLKL